MNQFKALLYKRYIHTVRNKSLLLSQIILPVFILLVNLLYIKYAVAIVDESLPLRIDLAAYGHNYIPSIFINANTDNLNEPLCSVSKYYKEQFSHLVDAKPFELNETNVLNFCDSTRNSIEDYLVCLSILSYKTLNKEHFIATEFKKNSLKYGNNDKYTITGYFNNQPYHTPPLALNLITNALLKHYTNSSQSSINIINRPLPKNFTETLTESSNKNLNSFRIASALNFGLSFLVASFSIFLIKENVSGAKHVQFLNSCNSYLFWLSGLLWDMINYCIPMICVLLLLIVMF